MTGGIGLQDPALPHHGNDVGCGQGLLLVMGDEDGGGACLGQDGSQLALAPGPGGWHPGC